jgi:hypothetical protein
MARGVGFLLVVCLALCAGSASAQEFVRPELRATRVTTPPAIDGVLDDAAWQNAQLPIGEFLSYNPLHGSTVPQKTSVWMSYDSDYLYFAFRCDDPEPSSIKTSVTRRDNIWQDDWVGLSLDALGSGQLSYHLMVNASGVQLDMLNSVAGGEDTSPDWIWDSASQLTETGFSAEIRLPLQSIRFAGGPDTRMGVLFWRRVSRLGVSVAWPPLEPGSWVFERHANLHFADIQPRLVREVLPSATYGRTTLRDSPGRWGASDSRSDVGLSAKLGLTSTIVLDATVNPDFSQVESDAFQVEVNQRFPVFFGEKRPFFMEGAGIFALAGAGNGDNTLRAAVHTRRIIDPIFGAKLTGTAGRLAFGTLTAVDEAGEDNRFFNIGRAQYALGSGSYIGALYTNVESSGTHNRVAGADMRWRIDDAQQVNTFVLASTSRGGVDVDSTSGLGAQLGYDFFTRKWGASGTFEHYGTGFQMDTAFMNRVGVTGAWGYVERNFYPDNTKHPWLRRFTIFSFTQGGDDEFAGGGEFLTLAGVRLAMTRQGNLRVDYMAGHEHWAGERFKRGRPRISGNMQVFRWLAVEGFYGRGHSIFYDPVDPYQGRSIDINFGVTLQPSGRLAQTIEYQRVMFDEAVTRQRVYTLDIVNTRTTYQFTRALAVRGIAQFDSSRRRVLTDFLGSYEPRPGTVVYAGYGALVEQREFIDGQWVPMQGAYLTTQRGLFLKASYLYRF